MLKKQHNQWKREEEEKHRLTGYWSLLVYWLLSRKMIASKNINSSMMFGNRELRFFAPSRRWLTFWIASQRQSSGSAASIPKHPKMEFWTQRKPLDVNVLKFLSSPLTERGGTQQAICGMTISVVNDYFFLFRCCFDEFSGRAAAVNMNITSPRNPSSWRWERELHAI